MLFRRLFNRLHIVFQVGQFHGLSQTFSKVGQSMLKEEADSSLVITIYISLEACSLTEMYLMDQPN